VTGVVAVSTTPTNRTMHFKVDFSDGACLSCGISGFALTNIDITTGSTCTGLGKSGLVGSGLGTYKFDVTASANAGCDVSVRLTGITSIIDAAGNQLAAVGAVATVHYGAFAPLVVVVRCWRSILTVWPLYSQTRARPRPRA
jgi:hypothetical protein